MMNHHVRREVLANTGTIFVTRTAARHFAIATGNRYSGEEEARKKLTLYLLGARRSRYSGTGEPEWWRARSPRTGLDIEVKIVREGPLAIVTFVNVRPFTPQEPRSYSSY